LSAGALNPGFGSGGVATVNFGAYSDTFFSAKTVALPDGTVVVADAVQNASTGKFSFAVAELTRNGSPKTDFGSGGQTIVDFGTNIDAFYLANLIVRPDGTIVLGGSAADADTGQFEFAMAELTRNGSLKSSFGSGGEALVNFGTNFSPYLLGGFAVQPDGTIVLASAVNNNTTFNSDFAVAELTKDGSPNSSFGSGGQTIVDFGPSVFAYYMANVVVQPDGTIVLGGHALTATGQDFVVAELTRNGSPNSSFGNGGQALVDFGTNTYATLLNFVVRPEGTIVLGGSLQNFSTGEQDFAVAELTRDGSANSGFGSGGKTLVNFGADTVGYNLANFVVRPDGAIVLGGSFIDFSSGIQYLNGVAELTPNGSLNTGFGTGGKTVIDLGANTIFFLSSLAVQPDGTIVLSGALNTVVVAELTPTGTLNTSFGTGGQQTIDSLGGIPTANLAVMPDGAIVVWGIGLDGTSGQPGFGVAELSGR
jgi:uncharacterized delta-60 repeat protein